VGNLDLATLIGFILGLIMCVFGIVYNGDTGAVVMGNLINFRDIPSVFITIGGSLAGVLACHAMPDFVAGLKGFTLSFKGVKSNTEEVIRNIIALSNVARKEGLLALEEAANDIEDDFLKKGIMLVADGTDPELVRGILETELINVEQRHKTVIGFWDKWAELGPAWGMIGTLIGLVNMLQQMDDPDSIGPSMAVALLTTLYGSLVANWLCGPTSAKLAVNNGAEMMMKEVTVEGLLSIQAGENPRIIEEKLKSFLSPKAREAMNQDGGGE
jgi:chemotaxis protein MotA